MTTAKTAAGEISVVTSAFSAVRGGTRIFFGSLPCGRFVVASRFQIEIRTNSRERAASKFKEITADARLPIQA